MQYGDIIPFLVKSCSYREKALHIPILQSSTSTFPFNSSGFVKQCNKLLLDAIFALSDTMSIQQLLSLLDNVSYL